MISRLTSRSLAGTARTEVAVGTERLSSMRRAMAAAAPDRGTARSPSSATAASAQGWEGGSAGSGAAEAGADGGAVAPMAGEGRAAADGPKGGWRPSPVLGRSSSKKSRQASLTESGPQGSGGTSRRGARCLARASRRQTSSCAYPFRCSATTSCYPRGTLSQSPPHDPRGRCPDSDPGSGLPGPARGACGWCRGGGSSGGLTGGTWTPPGGEPVEALAPSLTR